MPFEQTHVVEARRRFVQESYRSGESFSAICRKHGISRKAGYYWRSRYEAEGDAGLEDRSRKPRSCPWATQPEVVGAILEVKRRHPFFGAKKIRWYLQEHRSELDLPSVTTIHDHLDRAGLVERRRRRVRRWHPGRPTTAADEPNSVWTVDYKGEFRTGDGVLCYPLTTKDLCARYLLGCKGLTSTKTELAQPVFTRLFRKFGLPRRIRSDNGVPFASNALGRLSTLSVWFVQLGIIPELIKPSSPHQNGSHENTHGQLKKQTALKPRASLRAQQRAFDAFRHEYNQVRPHEALDGRTPGSLYEASPRPYANTFEPLRYPAHFEVRRVSRNGGVRWYSRWVNVSHLMAELPIGFEEIDHGLFDVYFGPVWLGLFNETKGRIVDSRGRDKRRSGGNHKRPRL